MPAILTGGGLVYLGILSPKERGDAEMDPKQKLVDQRATNAQTLTFIADQQAAMADQAEALTEESPEARADQAVSQIAELERAHRRTLIEVAEDERRLATTIQLHEEPDGQVAAEEREHRKTLLEIAREEERLANQLLQPGEQDPTLLVIAEQALRNRDLLRHVARTETDADRALRGEDPPAEEVGPRYS